MIPNYLTESRSLLEMTCRQNCQTVHLSDRAILCRVLGKYIMYAHPEDIGITPHLCLNGFWESWITIAMARTLRPGMFCLDIGANHGYYTLIMADAVGESGRVLAMEPNPTLAGMIELSIEVNGFQKNTTTLQKAAYDRDLQTVKLLIPKNRWLNATLSRNATVSDDVVEVQTVTIDEATKDWPRVDLVKIDAEGSEERIWRGMAQTLARNHDITLIMEINCARYGDSLKFVQEIQNQGFMLHHIDSDAAIQTVSTDQVLSRRHGGDWTLFLRRF
jgi:FkbM family methyltransferase